MKKLIALTLVAFALSACPKRADTTVAGSDEEQLDQYSSRLEELRTRAQAENPSCSDTCKMAREVCDIAQKVCDIATRLPDRGQERCVSANEDCAQFNDRCAACGGQ